MELEEDLGDSGLFSTSKRRGAWRGFCIQEGPQGPAWPQFLLFLDSSILRGSGKVKKGNEVLERDVNHNSGSELSVRGTQFHSGVIKLGSKPAATKPLGAGQCLPQRRQCQSGRKKRILGQEVEWKAGLDLVRSWLPASLRAPLWGPGPRGQGAAQEEAEPSRGRLREAWRVLRAAMAGAVVSYSSYVPPGFPKPPIKFCETVQPRLSWVGAN